MNIFVVIVIVLLRESSSLRRRANYLDLNGASEYLNMTRSKVKPRQFVLAFFVTKYEYVGKRFFRVGVKIKTFSIRLFTTLFPFMFILGRI